MTSVPFLGVEWWVVTAAANLVLVVLYGSIAAVILRGIVAGRQWFTNPLATATFAIFATCAFGHGVHLFHTTVAYVLGLEPEIAGAARLTFADPRLMVWDIFTAAIAIWYWTLRSRFGIVLGGAALCADMDKRHKQALQLHDNVVQGLAQAKLALELGRRDEGARVVEATLESSKRIINEILGTAKGTLGLTPGDLRRQAPGG